LYTATGGPNMKWGAQILYGGPGTTAPPRWRWLCIKCSAKSRTVL